LIEISSGGKEPISVDGGTRSFLEDGDTVVLRGWANGEGYKIGFGPCVGQLLTALPIPDWAK
jgi:fumarylacetoacetase